MSAELRHRYGDLGAADVASLDAAAVRSGVSVLQLMEVAGWQVARCAWRLLHRRPAGLLVVAGRGNNGGDGAVAARHLAAWGCDVALVLAGAEAELRAPLADHLVSARASAVAVSEASDAGAVPAAIAAALPGRALVIDALLGTGLRGAPRDLDAAAIAAMSAATVLAVDVPSGLDATTGEAQGACVSAAATCTLAAMKRGLWTPSGRARAGVLHVADIGMPTAAWRESGLAAPAAVRGGALLRVPVD
jgi:ADP-dependent NAD(P)H-hydrate dehydratase / NAD(P)H-hydrate epimerase